MSDFIINDPPINPPIYGSTTGAITFAEVEDRLVEAMLTCWRNPDRERGWQRLTDVKTAEVVEHVKQTLSAGGMPTERQLEKLFEQIGFSGSKAGAMSTACKPYLRGEPEAKADSDAFWTGLGAVLGKA